VEDNLCLRPPILAVAHSPCKPPDIYNLGRGSAAANFVAPPHDSPINTEEDEEDWESDGGLDDGDITGELVAEALGDDEDYEVIGSSCLSSHVVEVPVVTSCSMVASWLTPDKGRYPGGQFP